MKPVGMSSSLSFSVLIFPLREFLTGFHKRKLAKKEAARSRAKEREKQERLEARREVHLHPYVVSYPPFWFRAFSKDACSVNKPLKMPLK